MSHSALFYRNPVPISPQRHALSCIDTRIGFGFARHAQAVMIAASEFASVSRDYPIVFIPGAETDIPVALLGLRTDQNLFVNDAGEWAKAYIPAYVRRYPFILSGDSADAQLAVCIDEDFAGFGQDRGERLFLDDGSQSPYLHDNIRFLQMFQNDFEQTRQAMLQIRSAGLLEPMAANIATNDGKKLQVQGFLTINRARLKDLNGDVLAGLNRSSALELIYLHLASLNTFNLLVDRFSTLINNATAA